LVVTVVPVVTDVEIIQNLFSNPLKSAKEKAIYVPYIRRGALWLIYTLELFYNYVLIKEVVNE